jgi:hypothetical protein
MIFNGRAVQLSFAISNQELISWAFITRAVSQEFRKTTDQLDALLREFENTPSISREKSSRRVKKNVINPAVARLYPNNSNPKHTDFSQAASTPEAELVDVLADADNLTKKGALVKRGTSKKTSKLFSNDSQATLKTHSKAKIKLRKAVVPKDDKTSDLSSEEGEAHALISTMAKLAEERNVERLRRNAEVTSRYKSKLQCITMETEKILQNAADVAALKLSSRLDRTRKQVSDLEDQFLSAIKFAKVCLNRRVVLSLKECT